VPLLGLLIDTDTASDDAVALLMAAAAALAGRIRLHAVTTVAGNVPLARTTRNALVTLELAGAGSVPVHEGCDRPVIREAATAQHVHGPDGMSNTKLPDPVAAAADGHAVDVLLRAAREHGHELTLVTLGPLTNVAAALLRDRELLQRFRHTYCMAGSADAVGNISSTAEFNVWADPEATAVVLAAATPASVTFVGWDASRRDVVLDAEAQEQLRQLGTPLAWFADRINRAVEHWARTVTGLPGYDLPDPLAMAVALRPDLVTDAETASARVVLGDEARGQLLVDRRHLAAAPNVTLVRRVNADGFRALLFEACATTPGTAERLRPVMEVA
jgi:purine nucleosidase